MTDLDSAGSATAPADDIERAGVLRAGMVRAIAAWHEQVGLPLPSRVREVLLRVPRHLFTPGVSLEQAYADESIVTKRNVDGIDISAVSAPKAISGMLAQCGDLTGARVLEIGSGGCNAAMLRELVGPAGEVTTVDIDAEVVARARACLDRAGYGNVRTLRVDGEFGVPEHAPYDLIMITVGAWDVAPAYREQLVEGGLLVLPLRTRGLTRSWALRRRGDRLESVSQIMCGFVPMQGVGAHDIRSVQLHEAGVTLMLDELGPVDTDGLGEALDSPRAEVWSGVTIDRHEWFADQDLWLLTMPEFCRLVATQDAVDQDVVRPSWRIATPALAAGGSLAYRARFRLVDEARGLYEFGTCGHGPDGARLAERLAEEIRVWDRDHRGGPGPTLTVLPLGDAPAGETPDGFVLKKRHSALVMSWPGTDR
ncbi:methyltransferase, FxLD system [Frankia sp. CNm7]|uniref:Protein-L-isoaspartate O-methyltransferase n=1 Tax=Frankia nepalensis TaxID=1836974 RepID=A0A937RBC7_9ACTN|nr:methyltransferase, FxLD system [Frankia nepalensis]MBL7499877.1 methyltransferase, FxLD system [Frankia nepalensis]MBL7512305.1 methyltransferase, FxLD system [Frankia nepalensis]MBL7516972.1 methyltransferase, FxLD system [Frankia nepalensis]MBL7629013.1 methyltransferase, FxLD system [Frankia nepalensis]